MQRSEAAQHYESISEGVTGYASGSGILEDYGESTLDFELDFVYISIKHRTHISSFAY